MNTEELQKLEKMEQKFSELLNSDAYTKNLESITQVYKDHFDMLDRSFSVARTLHEFESKNIDLWIDIIKFLFPVLATALIAGLTVDSSGLETTLLAWIGGAGLVVSLFALMILVQKRNRIIKRQQEEYGKLVKVFSDWKKVADTQQSLANIASMSDEQILELQNQIMELQKEYPVTEVEK